MTNLGELFIQLGVIGDIKPLEDALNKTKEQIALTQRQVQLDNARAKALEKIRQATTKADKQRIAKAYKNEKQLIMQQAQEAGINRQITAHKALGQQVGKVVTGIAAFVGAVTAAAVAMNKLTNDLVQSNQAFLDLTRTSDIALGTFQKWDNIGKMFGVQNAAQQLEGLNQRLFELRLTGQGARGFQLAGINPAGDAESVMEQLRGRVAGMSDTSASYLLQQMGLDPKMLHILRLGRAEFEELGQTVRKYQLTPQQSKNIQQMNVQLQIAAIKLQYLKQRAVLALMPAFVELAKSFARVTEMLMRWGKAIKNANVWWRGLITGLVYGLARIEKVRLFFIGLSKGLSACITKIPIFGKLLGSLGVWARKALLPLTLLYLLLDDLAVYFEGGDSLIGRVMEWGKERGGELAEGFKTLFGGGGVGQLNETTTKILDDIYNTLTRLVELCANFFTFGFFGKVMDSANNNGIDAKKLLKGSLQLTTGNVLEGFKNYMGAFNTNEGQATGGAAGIPSKGYEGTLPSLTHKGIVSPATEQVINNNNSKISTTTSNPQITQTNYIQTNQPAYDIERELGYINMRVVTTG